MNHPCKKTKNCKKEDFYFGNLHANYVIFKVFELNIVPYISCRPLPHPGAIVDVPPGEDDVWPASSVQLERLSPLPAGGWAVEGWHCGAVRHLQWQHSRWLPVSVCWLTFDPSRTLFDPSSNNKKRARTPVSEAEREVMVKCSPSHTCALCNTHWSGGSASKARLSDQLF